MRFTCAFLTFLFAIQAAAADCDQNSYGMFQLREVDFAAAANGSQEDLKIIEACGSYMYVARGAAGQATFHPYFEAWFHTRYDFPRSPSSSTDQRSALECKNGSWQAGFLSYKQPLRCVYAQTPNVVLQAEVEGRRLDSIIHQMNATLAEVRAKSDAQVQEFCDKLNGDKYRTPAAFSNFPQVCREDSAVSNRVGLVKAFQIALGQLEIQKAGAYDARQVFGVSASYNRSDDRIYSRCGGGIDRAPWAGYYPSAVYYSSLANLLRAERCESQDFTTRDCVAFGRVYAAEVIAYHAFEPCGN